MEIVAIDPSLTATGIVWNGPGNSIHYDVIKPGKLRGTPRLDYIHAYIYDVMTERTIDRRVELVVMEGYNYGAARGRGNPGRLFDIGELGGMIKMEMQTREVPLLIVPPASLKMFVTGNGVAQKPDMIAAVEKQWGVTTKSDNIADAVGLYYFGLAHESPRKRRRYSEKQKSALAGAEWDLK
jgi:Holliday junction resolvasome RuvABC endonuclease subunit